jgi:hypothetical protein
MKRFSHRPAIRPFVPFGLLSLLLLPAMLIPYTSGNPLMRPLGGIEFHTFDESFIDFIGTVRYFRFEPEDFPRSQKLTAFIAFTDSGKAHLSIADNIFIDISRRCRYRDFISVLDILDQAGFSSTYVGSSILTGHGNFYAGPAPMEAPWLKTMPLLKKIFYDLERHNYAFVNRTKYLLDALHDTPWLFLVLFYWEMICYANIYRLIVHHQTRRRLLNKLQPMPAS